MDSLRQDLVGVSPTDPVALLASASALLIVTLITCLRPAWQALRLDPASALRLQ